MGAKQTKLDEKSTDNNMVYPKIPKNNVNENETLTDNLRRFLNLNDPRSPSSVLNRTPLLLDDKNDKTLNLDDTFADLFVASECTTKPVSKNLRVINDKKLLDNKNESLNEDLEKSLSISYEGSSMEFVSLCEEETLPSPASLKPTPLILQQQLIDPRSPTLLPRTPIIFDDEEAQEDAMLEGILATLSLDLSSASGNSFIAGNSSVCDAKKPNNKHLDRVRAVKKPEKPKRKSKQLAQKQRIYLDNENIIVTPKRATIIVNGSQKRTPLSCVKNRAHLRSRSVESKSPKQRLSLTSFDDSLNPVQDNKVKNLHTFLGDAFDL